MTITIQILSLFYRKYLIFNLNSLGSFEIQKHFQEPANLVNMTSCPRLQGWVVNVECVKPLKPEMGIRMRIRGIKSIVIKVNFTLYT